VVLTISPVVTTLCRGVFGKPRPQQTAAARHRAGLAIISMDHQRVCPGQEECRGLSKAPHLEYGIRQGREGWRDNASLPNSGAMVASNTALYDAKREIFIRQGIFAAP